MRLTGYARSIQVLLLALLLSGCGEEKSPPPPPAPQSPAQVAPTAPAVLTESATPPVAPAIAVPAAAGNALPKVDTVKLTPGVVLPGTNLKAEVATSDPDGDLVLLEYEWKRNDQVISEAVTDELDTTGFRKGDLVTVSVTPFDGKQKGVSKRSLPIVILNRPPEITSFPSAAIAAGRYIYEVRAEDPDGDKLTFSLETAPQGMAIEPASGRLEWDIPADLTGDFPIRVIATDGDARSFQGFKISLKKEPAK